MNLINQLDADDDAFWSKPPAGVPELDLDFVDALFSGLITTNFDTSQPSKLTFTNIQRRFLELANRDNRLIILKSRQMFITTAAIFYAFCAALVNPGLRVGLVLDSHDKAKDKLEIISNWASQLGCETELDNSKALVLRNPGDGTPGSELAMGSRIKTISAHTPISSGRGLSFDLIIFSELPFYKYAKQIWATLLPGGSSGVKVIVESTPNSPVDLFHQIWAGDNGWTKKFFGFEEHESYQLNPASIPNFNELWPELQRLGLRSKPHAAWYWTKLQQDYNGDFHRFRQNYPIEEKDAWMGLADKFIRVPDKFIVEYWVSDLHPNLHIFHNPTVDEFGKAQTYIYGYDPSGSRGGDHSAITVFDKTGKLMASFYDNTTQADKIVELFKSMKAVYPPQIIVLETNGVGANLKPFMEAAGLPVSTRHTDFGEKYLNFLSCKRAIEEDGLVGDTNLFNEAASLEQRIKEDNPSRPYWWGADDLLTSCGLALRFINHIHKPKPEILEDANRYYKVNERPKPKRLDTRHLL